MATEEYPRCVFNPDEKCSVRHEMQKARSLQNVILPKGQEAQIIKEMMQGMVSALGADWGALAGFCHVCPKLVELRIPPRPPTLSARGPMPVKLNLLQHDIVIERVPGAKKLVEGVEKFAKLDRASKDVLIFTLNRLSLWKAAERVTPDQVIDFLKKHAKTAPSDSLKRWIAGTMSAWGSLKIIPEENYHVLEVTEEKILDRVRSMRGVKDHLFRRLTPTKARIVQGRRGDLKKALMEKGYPVKDLGRYDEFTPVEFSLKPEVTKDPRWIDYEKHAMEEFLRYGAGTVVLPAGSGKTVVAVAVAAALNAPTLVLTTRAQICKQFEKEFLSKTDIPKSLVSTITADVPKRRRSVEFITITTYDMVTQPGSTLAGQIWKKQWGLICYDEVQHIPARVWSRTTDMQAVRRLGTTATPIREDKLEKMIFSLVGPPVFERNWLEMAEKGHIAKARLFEILVDMAPAAARRYTRSTDGRERYILASTNTAKIPVIKRLLEKHKDDQVLIIGYYVDGAQQIGKMFRIPVIWHEVSPKVRDTLYNEFRRGERKRLVLTSVGEEGVDLPNAKVLIEVCANWGSRMQMGQRFGRILRRKDEEAIFYELVSRGTSEEQFSEKRRQFLISKGYEFEQFVT